MTEDKLDTIRALKYENSREYEPAEEEKEEKNNE
ncbi:MAG: hypothetical protein DDT22_00939 [candidate division WS2 bacterium]|nr:hypothetical protein [Bacillota bacterium]MBT9175265.1 hypothetical protein [Candidatus Lithacetigena glycinireducens]